MQHLIRIRTISFCTALQSSAVCYSVAEAAFTVCAVLDDYEKMQIYMVMYSHQCRLKEQRCLEMQSGDECKSGQSPSQQ